MGILDRIKGWLGQPAAESKGTAAPAEPTQAKPAEDQPRQEAAAGDGQGRDVGQAGPREGSPGG